MSTDYNLKFNKLPKSNSTVTFHIQIGYLFKLRLWLAVQLLKITCWLLNSEVEFINEWE